MQSVWSAGVGVAKPRPSLENNIKTDVLIIGAGIAGILTAHRLREAGAECVVLEAKTALSGVTRGTTAKITAQHGLIFSDIIKKFGVLRAKQYLDSHRWAVSEYRKLSTFFPCDFEDRISYIYSSRTRSSLDREAEAYQALGLPLRFTDNPPIPVKTFGALGMDGQAQFNPLKMLMPIADSLEIYENTPVHRIDKDVTRTSRGSVTAQAVVLATHFPIINIPGLYFIKMHQRRGYVIALENAPPVDAMYRDEYDEGFSFRTYGDLLLVGGGDNRTGKNPDGLRILREFCKRTYPQVKERHVWAAQDCMTLDGIPYIGQHRASRDNLYVATGFNKWGMTGSMVASRLLSELITSGKSDWSALYNPQRSILHPQLAANAASAVAGLTSIGAPRCAHMGCKLHYNKAEKTWDCSCHGSRYDERGALLDNPAKHGLKKRPH